MDLAASIDRLGFRRWYERKLIEAHAYFVTCFLCMIVAAVSLEGVQPLSTPTFQSVQMLLLVLAGTGIALHSYNRFRMLLGEAERYAEHSVCEQCDAYGIFTVMESGAHAATRAGRAEDREVPPNIWLRVRCKKCSHEWRLPE